VIRLNIPRAPLWLHEGLAEFYGTFAGSERDNRSVLGRPLPYHLSVLHHHPLIPLQVLLSPDVRKVAFRTRVSTGVFYAESWALVHYLLLGEQGRHRRGLQQLLARQHSARGVSDEEFRSAFGMAFADMEAAVKAHIGRMQIPALQLVDPPEVEGTPDPEPMLEIDALQVQGDLLVKLGQATDAERFLQKALALDRHHRRARLSLAQCRLVDGRYAEALDVVEPVARESPGEFAAQWLHGEALRMAERYPAAIEAYGRAVALNPADPSSHFGAAVAQLAAGHPDADATFARLMRLDPDPGWHFSRMYDAWLAGRSDLALADAVAFLDGSAWESDRSVYAALIVAVEQVRAGRRDEAATILATAAEHAEERSWLGVLVGVLQNRVPTPKLLERADSEELKMEAHTYIGLKASVEGRHQEALTYLAPVEEKARRASAEYKLARGELKRLRSLAAAPAEGHAR
jgi:tetratricopeptide (TPR) repeat protein